MHQGSKTLVSLPYIIVQQHFHVASFYSIGYVVVFYGESLAGMTTVVRIQNIMHNA